MISEVSGGKTHTKQLGTGRMDIHGLCVRTFESATYTILLLTFGSSNHREKGSVIYFGIEGRCHDLFISQTHSQYQEITSEQTPHIPPSIASPNDFDRSSSSIASPKGSTAE